MRVPLLYILFFLPREPFRVERKLETFGAALHLFLVSPLSSPCCRDSGDESNLNSNSYIQNSLINIYAKSGSMLDTKSMFDSCSNLDPVSCDIMIAGYVNCGNLSNAHQVFAKMPKRGCVSYTTMIMGFAQNDYRREAVEAFKDMISAGVIPNEVTMASVISTWSQLGGIWNCRGIMVIQKKNLSGKEVTCFARSQIPPILDGSIDEDTFKK